MQAGGEVAGFTGPGGAEVGAEATRAVGDHNRGMYCAISTRHVCMFVYIYVYIYDMKTKQMP